MSPGKSCCLPKVCLPRARRTSRIQVGRIRWARTWASLFSRSSTCAKVDEQEEGKLGREDVGDAQMPGTGTNLHIGLKHTQLYVLLGYPGNEKEVLGEGVF